MADPVLVIIVMISFGLAGLVKGVVGLGLPTVSLGILSLFVDLPTAMVLLIMPSFCTNIWQALAGGGFRQLVWRLWPFLLAAILMVHVGGALFTRIDVAFLERALGGLLLLYALSGLVGRVPHIAPNSERLIGIACGAINGLADWVDRDLVRAGSDVLQALNFPRDKLVQAMEHAVCRINRVSWHGPFLEWADPARPWRAVWPCAVARPGRHVRWTDSTPVCI